MDVLTQKSIQKRLKRELNKSLGSVRLSKSKKLTLAYKSKIKKAAVKCSLTLFREGYKRGKATERE